MGPGDCGSGKGIDLDVPKMKCAQTAVVVGPADPPVAAREVYQRWTEHIAYSSVQLIGVHRVNGDVPRLYDLQADPFEQHDLLQVVPISFEAAAAYDALRRALTELTGI